MSFMEHWNRRRREALKVTEQGGVIITHSQGRIQVTCPESDQFDKLARELGGVWRPKTAVWTFQVRAIRLVKAALLDCFGEGCIQ